MWKTVAPIAVLVAALVVLLVPFHPEAVVLQAVVGATPHTPFAFRVDWFLVETGGNFVMFAAVGTAARLLLRRNALALIAACSVSAAAELAQVVIPDRVASWSDLTTNVLGALAGVAFASATANRLHHTAGEQSSRQTS